MRTLKLPAYHINQRGRLGLVRSVWMRGVTMALLITGIPHLNTRELLELTPFDCEMLFGAY